MAVHLYRCVTCKADIEVPVGQKASCPTDSTHAVKRVWQIAGIHVK